MATAYYDSNGRIMCVVSIGEMEAPDGAAGHASIDDGASPNDYWFDGQFIQAKAVMALTVARNRLAGIPAGATVFFDEHAVVVDDGIIEFDADTETMLRVIVEHPHYIEQIVQVPTGPEVAE